ncbi:hypothetical protein BJ741DRAFT_652528 [Chytriomyces cf. hyalinus JEL632]|nr:hypothetical protein BJ741DRAFT_652528 [Chytriomyces cf. hyalinus JEL632]
MELMRPENLMVAMDGFIKIITSDHLIRLHGTGRYIAREVLTGKGYGIMADMCSMSPGRLILHRTPISLSPVFSANTQDFVSRCLSIDQVSRMSAVEAARHPFLDRQ